MKILLTGANGFVGQTAIPHLQRAGHTVRAAVRRDALFATPNVELAPDTHLEFDDPAPWRTALEGCDVVVHSAGLAHVPLSAGSDAGALIEKINVTGTEKLATLAAEAGCKRFVFLSSIKVNGERTLPGKPFRETDTPAPEDAYGFAKLGAERVLMAIAEKTGLEVTIIRPPLVYGPGMKGNLARLARLLKKGMPLPLGGIKNQRSLIGTDNLADLICTVIAHPNAANDVFLSGDGEDVSTTELLQLMAQGMGVKPRLLPVPPILLETALKLIGKGNEADKLYGSLQVDTSKALTMLGWRAPVPLVEGMARIG